MRTVRTNRVLRLFAAALALWLMADALSHGVCAHDLVAFARAATSQVGSSQPAGHAAESGDPAHCACHWQYLPAPEPRLLSCQASMPMHVPPPIPMPQPSRVTLERPPQRG